MRNSRSCPESLGASPGYACSRCGGLAPKAERPICYCNRCDCTDGGDAGVECFLLYRRAAGLSGICIGCAASEPRRPYSARRIAIAECPSIAAPTIPRADRREITAKTNPVSCGIKGSLEPAALPTRRLTNEQRTAHGGTVLHGVFRHSTTPLVTDTHKE